MFFVPNMVNLSISDSICMNVRACCVRLCACYICITKCFSSTHAYPFSIIFYLYEFHGMACFQVPWFCLMF